jgi:hypothetical protein
MRDNRDKWQFYAQPANPALEATDVQWWKKLLTSLLKVGIEFEFNLPEPKPGCKGDDPSCHCSLMSNNCWTTCANTDSCQQLKNNHTCLKGETCEKQSCLGCSEYVFKCLGLLCTDFISKCVSCMEYKQNCESCPNRTDPKQDPNHIRAILGDDLAPTNSYGKFNESGVVNITTDGSLTGDKGVEIITIGRRVDYWEFFHMSKRILDKAAAHGAFVNERTSTHMHVLNSYFEKEGINELEKPMPAIILANFHQLVRRYQNALTWITMALDHPNALTRWEKFRMSVLDISAVSRDADSLIEAVSSSSGGNKYGFVNYMRTRATKEGFLDRIHVEFREADSAMCPSFYAAIACLHYAFIIKAVEISKYGVLKVGSSAWLKQAKAMKEIILNGKGDWSSKRMSNTSKVLDNKEYFIEESLDMISQMKNILIKLGPAYDVLMKLARQPIALRRIDGFSFEDIEKQLAVTQDADSLLDQKLSETIDLKLIDMCKELSEWISQVKKMLDEEKTEASEADIARIIDIKMREGEVVWSNSTGCIISI